jgi:RND family efflux transporter MFP subunit
MKWLYVLACLAVLGLVAAIVAVVADSHRSAASDSIPIRAPAVPYKSYVAGTGITETGRGNVAVGTPVAGVVSEVNVQVGDNVNAGDPLFRIDDRDLRARRVTALADLRRAEADLAKPKHRLEFLEHLQGKDQSAVSVESLRTARDDLHSASAALDAAKAATAQIDVDIGRTIVRAPLTGRVLQVNVRVGEFAANDSAARPPVLIGHDVRIYLRVDVDESDAWRVWPGAAAIATLPNQPDMKIPLRFEYIEPYVVPKATSLGQVTERPDRRVLQVVYSFDPPAFAVYLGQQLDAFIEASASH